MVPAGLEVEGFGVGPPGAAIRLRANSETARCPACGGRSRRVYRRYIRKAADLPWHGVPVVLLLSARRFFCDEPSCGRRIFCERLLDVAARARKTGRLEEALLASITGPRTTIAIAGLLILTTPLLLPRHDHAPQHEREPAQSHT